jgi:uncharacterized protein (TIGR03437 family)
VAVSKDDRTLFVGSGQGFVGIFDIPTSNVIGRITRPDLFKPNGGIWTFDPQMKMSPDGRRLYVSNLFPALTFNPDFTSPVAISVIDIATNGVIANIPGTAGGYLGEILVSPDSKLVYSTSLPGVTIINAVTNAVISPAPTATPFLNKSGTVLSPDGKFLYFSTRYDAVPDAVYAISAVPNPDLNTKPLWTIPTPKNPVSTGFLRQLTVSPDGKFLYVIDSIGQSYIYVIDIAARAAIATVTLGPPGTYTGTYAIIYVPAVPSVTISIVIPATTLSVGQIQQFTAIVSNDANTGVIWSLSGPGSISPSGLYTPPSVITSKQTVTLTATSVADPSKSVSATITLTPPTEVITTEGVVNAASRAPGPAAPGEILTISGSGFGPPDAVAWSPDVSEFAPTVLAGVRVLFDGVPGSILYAASGQVSTIVPYALSGKASTQVQVEYRGERSNPVVILITAVSPGIFTPDSSGSGQAMLLNDDGTQNTPSNPASIGSTVVFYVTGTGVSDPPGIDGQVSGDPPPTPRATITAYIAGMDAEVLSASAVPGSVAGLVQVKIRLPVSSPTGDAVPLDMSADGIGSQSGVTLAIR